MSGEVQVHHVYENLSFLSICPVVNGTRPGSVDPTTVTVKKEKVNSFVVFSSFFPSA